MSINISKLISKANNSKEFIELKKYYKRMSFMQIAGCSRLELQHSNFIAWLLNSKSDHELGFIPIIKFLSMIAICKENEVNQGIDYEEDFLNLFINETFDITDVSIETERAVSKDKKDSKKRIDIEILVSAKFNKENKILPIIIENKVKSKEHDKQTKYYYEWSKKQYDDEEYLKPIFVYLTPNIDDEPECDEFIRISYQNLIDLLIEPLYYFCKDEHSKIMIEDYLRCLSYTSIDLMKKEKGDIIMGYSPKELKLLHEFWDKNKDLMYAVAKSLEDDETIDEEEMKKIKPIIEGINVKDYSKYEFEGNIYNKRRLVLAVVKSYVDKNPDITYAELLKIFPDELNDKKTLGVIRKISEINDNTRYFTSEAIKLADAEVAICNQWGKLNISIFIDKAKENGMRITKK